jgi:hypothetical protein
MKLTKFEWTGIVIAILMILWTIWVIVGTMHMLKEMP